jgi:four helix bundle protein
MKGQNVLILKSYSFSIEIVSIHQELVRKKSDYTLSRQLLRSGTSIGANLEECIGAQTKKDFYAKLCIAQKEARETNYWLRLMRDTHYINAIKANELLNQCDELLKMLAASIITTRRNLQQESNRTP